MKQIDPAESLLILPPRYMGSAAYYALVNAFGKVTVDTGMRFDKRQKDTHRATIADTHGVRRLTVPIEKPVSMTGARWSDITISSHGSWWHAHWETLKSGYGRTPFFEYYADDFEPLFREDPARSPLMEFNRRLDSIIRRLMLIESEVVYGGEISHDGPIVDLRKGIPAEMVRDVPYYQVRALRHGFIPGLSAVDMLFNMGPESALILPQMVL